MPTVEAATLERLTQDIFVARGVPSEDAAFIATMLVRANARGGLNVAPWGGAARRLGTNPHAVAIPGPGGTVAMSHDFATIVWAEGKLRVKFNRGEPAPPAARSRYSATAR